MPNFFCKFDCFGSFMLVLGEAIEASSLGLILPCYLGKILLSTLSNAPWILKSAVLSSGRGRIPSSLWASGIIFPNLLLITTQLKTWEGPSVDFWSTPWSSLLFTILPHECYLPWHLQAPLQSPQLRKPLDWLPLPHCGLDILSQGRKLGNFWGSPCLFLVSLSLFFFAWCPKSWKHCFIYYV